MANSKKSTKPQRKRKGSFQSSQHELEQTRENTAIADPPIGDILRQEATFNNIKDYPRKPIIGHWVEKGNWPAALFHTHIMEPLRNRTPATSPKLSTTAVISLRDGKDPDVRSEKYDRMLSRTNILVEKPEVGRRVTQESIALCHRLLDTKQPAPTNTLFDEDRFDMTCNGILNRNEARVIRDIALLIVPSAEGLFSGGAAQLKGLAELVNQRWMCSIQLMSGDAKMKLPHPDFTVGLHWSIFTDNQMKRLDSIAGGDAYRSRMKATASIYFPFLTCEVKCGIAANRIGDRQNVYSAAVACKGMVELYQTVGRERELNRQILVFSVGHDEQSVRLYGHYVYFEDTKIVFYRHQIHSFYFTALDGREKWTGYQFTRNVYDIFFPIHLKRVCSVLDQLPESYPPSPGDPKSQHPRPQHGQSGESPLSGQTEQRKPSEEPKKPKEGKASEKPPPERVEEGPQELHSYDNGPIDPPPQSPKSRNKRKRARRH